MTDTIIAIEPGTTAAEVAEQYISMKMNYAERRREYDRAKTAAARHEIMAEMREIRANIVFREDALKRALAYDMRTAGIYADNITGADIEKYSKMLVSRKANEGGSNGNIQ